MSSATTLRTEWWDSPEEVLATAKWIDERGGFFKKTTLVVKFFEDPAAYERQHHHMQVHHDAGNADPRDCDECVEASRDVDE